MSGLIRISGGQYRPIERFSDGNEHYLISHLRAAGIADCAQMSDESSKAYAVRLLHAVIENDVALDLLGGLLLPINVPDHQWTPETAWLTADILRGVASPEDKRQVHEAVSSVLLLALFRRGKAQEASAPRLLDSELSDCSDKRSERTDHSSVVGMHATSECLGTVQLSKTGNR